MIDWINALDPHWLWLIIGGLLGIAEILIPGFFLIWLSAAAIVTGIVGFLFPIPMTGQLALFAILAVIAVYSGRRWFAANPIESSDPNLNDRGARLIGESVIVVEAIIGGRGRVKVGDSVWIAKGADAKVGDRVRIAGSDGATLNVDPI